MEPIWYGAGEALLLLSLVATMAITLDLFKEEK